MAEPNSFLSKNLSMKYCRVCKQYFSAKSDKALTCNKSNITINGKKFTCREVYSRIYNIIQSRNPPMKEG